MPDDAVVDEHVADGIHIFATDFDGTTARRHHTIGDNDIFARAKLFKLTSVFQTDTVVAARDMAVGDTDIARMVDIDAIAIADFQVIEQIDPVNRHIIASTRCTVQ